MLLVITFLLLMTQYTICDNCIDSVKQYSKNITFTDTSNPILSTGTGIDDLGKYDQCLQSNKNKFVVVKMLATFELENKSKSDINFFLGLCTPDICATNEKLKELKTFISNRTKIAESKITVVDSQVENQVYRQLDVVSIIILISLIFYLLFALGLVKFFYEFIFIKKASKLVKETPKEDSKNSLSSNVINSEFPDNETNFNLEDNSLPRISFFYKILLACFDAKKNLSKVFEGRPVDDKDLKVFDGIRVVSSFVIIIDHVMSLLGELPLRNPEIAADYAKSFSWQFFANSYFCVDVFFSLSGFFLAYISLKNITALKNATFVQTSMGIFLRLLRIWPLYVIVFLWYWKFYIYFLDGPISGLVFNNELKSCDVQWPFMLTFLTNWTYGLWETTSVYCMSWYWYIPNDFQYSIIGTILIILYARSKKLFYIAFSLINIPLLFIEGYILIHYDIGVNLLEVNGDAEFFKNFYFKFYTRSSPFFLGLLLGIIYSNYKTDVKEDNSSNLRSFIDKVKSSNAVSLLLYFIGLSIMCFCVFITYWSYDHPWSGVTKFLYNFLSKKFYVLGLFSFALPLMLGNIYLLGGWFGKDFFLPLARLSFAAYIFHPILVKFYIFNLRFAFFFNGYYILILGFSFIVSSYVIAIFLCMIFEMPFQNIREIMKKKSKEKVNTLL